MTLRQLRVSLDEDTHQQLLRLAPGRPAQALRAILLEVLAQQQLHVGAHLDAELQMLMAARSSSKPQRALAQVKLLAAWERRLRGICRGYASRTIEPADLLACAQMGLLGAAARWRLGTGWHSYAESHVRKELQRWVRRNGAMVMESEHELRRAKRTGEARRPKGWSDVNDL